MLATLDPRSNWDARDRESDVVETQLAHFVKIAKALGDPASIRLATETFDDLAKARAAYREQRAVLDEAVAAQEAAERELAVAQATEAAGTLDRKKALQMRDDVVALTAKVRHFAPVVRSAVASCQGLRERVSYATHGNAGTPVLTETRDLMKRLFEYKRLEPVFDAATAAGKKATAATAAWWPIVEAAAVDEFATRLAAAKAERADTGIPNPAGGWLEDPRREPHVFPTRANLETVFARRRDAFAAERRRVEAQLAALTGQLADLGGAQ
jgi:hypothetical protein